MEIEGKIILDLPMQEGVSKSGNPWKKKEWVLETFGQYPRKVKFTVFGEQRVNTINLEVGRTYILSFDLESREFNGRWYTDVTVYAAREAGDSQMGGGMAPQMAQQPQNFPPYGTPVPPVGGYPQQAPQGFAAPQGNESDDLPF